jgi:5-(carboxyamino)imidazole ribonucleotide mutase
MTMGNKIGIVMGSDSDLPVMSAAAKILDEFSVEYELTIVSAHRTPEKLFEYATSAEQRGLKLIIAGAGGAAHLPGMLASSTPLPVIGVPVKSRTLDGVDSLYSIVQMPPGVPVATVAINGALNAGLLALQILGCEDAAIREQMKKYKEDLKNIVDKKAEELEKIKYEKYLSKMQDNK